MHGRLARRHGVSTVQLDTLAAWHESPAFDARAKVALQWAEAVTNVAGGVPDADFADLRQHFDDRAIVDLTWAIVLINGWNRAMVAFRVPPEAR